MTHGLPDWGLRRSQVVYALDDLAELAVRLGSIVSYDRRGNVIFLEDWESGNIVRWDPTISGTGSTIGAVSTFAQNGSYSLEVVTGSELNSAPNITRRTPYTVLGKLGLEISLYVYSLTIRPWVVLTVHTGTNSVAARIRYTESTGVWEFYSSAGVWTAFATKVIYRGARAFHKLKIVADFLTRKFVRVLINEDEFDLSANALYAPASTLEPFISVFLLNENLATGNRKIYFDDIIVTQNEPD